MRFTPEDTPFFSPSGQPWGDHLLDVGVLTGMVLLGMIISAKTFRWEQKA